jgi:mRNA-degrading endonuclease RelE of RelBE toxin-antitoxin system
MEVAYSITLHPLVTTHDIPKLDSFWRITVRDAIRGKLKTNPYVYGKPLRHDLKSCRTMRVADYRVVFQIRPKVVHIIAIIHRSTDYKGVAQRL